MSLITDAMSNHIEDETVQLHAFTALTNLSHNSIDNRSRFIELNGISYITPVMSLHLKSSKIQRQACWAILTLAGNDEVSIIRRV